MSTHGDDAARQETLRVDHVNSRIWLGATPLPLPPKSFAILRYLIERPRRLVTKRELLEAAWPDIHVGEAVLKVTVLRIRKTLGDDAVTPRFIETVHRIGYRFVGTAETTQEVVAAQRVDPGSARAFGGDLATAVVIGDGSSETLREMIETARVALRDCRYADADTSMARALAALVAARTSLAE
jgi:DNA-binding winged helix-turn-helix (wHTH) protein